MAANGVTHLTKSEDFLCARRTHSPVRVEAMLECGSRNLFVSKPVG